MRLTVVGSGDAFCSGGRGTTCFHVEADGFRMAIDYGASAQLGCKSLGLPVEELDAVVLSHLHGDHFGGLPFLILDGQMGTLRARPLRIFGPKGTQARLNVLMEALYPGISRTHWRFEWSVEEVAVGTPAQVGPFSLRTTEVLHSSGAPSTAVRFEGLGRTLAYSGDSAWTPALFDVARDADLFICECCRFDGAPTGHMAYETIAANRDGFSARRMLLTHMSDDMWSRRAAVDEARFLIARDGLVLDV